jgi:tetratricopeptide (TPR) repeat protein
VEQPTGARNPSEAPIDRLDFGEMPPHVDQLLQRGVLAYRQSYEAAESCFRGALEVAPDVLPVYFCLYKIHTYQNRLDEALRAAEAGLGEAARQLGWSPDYHTWQVCEQSEGVVRFALYTLKALAFIRLKRGEHEQAGDALTELRRLDPRGYVGWRVVADLAEAL